MKKLLKSDAAEILCDYVKEMLTPEVSAIEVGKMLVNMVLVAVKAIPSPRFTLEENLDGPYLEYRTLQGKFDNYMITFPDKEIDYSPEVEFYINKDIFIYYKKYLSKLNLVPLDTEQDMRVKCKIRDILNFFDGNLDYRLFYVEMLEAVGYYNFSIDFESNLNVWCISWYYSHK